MGVGHTVGDGRSIGEKFGQAAVDASGVGAAFGLFGFEAVQFGEHIDGDAQVVFHESVERCGVMEKDVGIENVVFDDLRRGDETEFLGADGGGLAFFGGEGSDGVGIGEKRALRGG